MPYPVAACRGRVCAPGGAAPFFRVPLASDLNPTVGSAAASFGRASAASCLDSGGVLRTAASGAARFDYGGLASAGLLIEPQATNLLLYSADYSQAAWNLTNCAAPASTLGPDGTADAQKLTPSGGTTYHDVYESLSLGSGSYTFSMFAKASGFSWIALRVSCSGGYSAGASEALFNLSNGTVGTVQPGLTAHIVPVGNGYYRCSVTYTGPNAAGIAQVLIASADPGGTTLYPQCASDGVSAVNLFGAQLQTSTFADSYVATTSSATSRAVDSLTYPLALPTTGTVSCWVRTPWTGTDPAVHYVLDTGVSSTQDRLRIYYNPSSSYLTLSMAGDAAGGARELDLPVNGTNWAAGVWHHVLGVYSPAGPTALYLDGVAATLSGSSGTWSNAASLGTTLFVGQNISAGSQLSGVMRDLRVYSNQLQAADVAALYAAGALTP